MEIETLGTVAVPWSPLARLMWRAEIVYHPNGRFTVVIYPRDGGRILVIGRRIFDGAAVSIISHEILAELFGLPIATLANFILNNWPEDQVT